MANRCWVGGTGNWNDTAHWSATTGGAGGVSVPVAGDIVIFDSNSGTGTTTVTAGAVCRRIATDGVTFSGTPWSGTLAFTNQLTIGDAVNGAYTFAAATNITGTAGIRFVNTVTAATQLTSAGKTLGPLLFQGVGGSWTLADDHTVTLGTGLVSLTNGTLNTNGKTVTCTIFNSDAVTTRTLTLGASAINITGAGSTNGWNITQTTGLTFNPNTSTITLSATMPVFQGGGLTYNNVVFTGSTTKSLYGANTFANLTCTGAATRTEWLSVNDDQTVTGTLTLNGNSVLNRLLIRGASGLGRTGVVRTITSATNAITNADFQDVTGAGAASWNLSAITGNSGDCGGNSGITFTTAAAQAWSGTSGGNWSANAWTTRVPLPQDDVTVSAAFSASQTITVDVARLGKNVSFVGVTGSPALTVNNVGITASVYGSLTLAAGLGTVTLTTALGLVGYGSLTLTSAGKVFTGASALQVNAGSSSSAGTYTLADDLAVTATAFQVLGGTFASSTFNVSATTYALGKFLVSFAAPTIDMGSGTWSITDTATGSPWIASAPGALTVTPGTSVIDLSTASANARTFAGAGQTYTTLRYTVAGSTGALIITGANTFATLNVSGPSPHTLTLPSSTTTTITGNLILNGVQGSLTVLNSSVSGTAATISKSSGVIQPHFASIKDSTVTGGTVAEVIGGTLVSGNTGWTALPQAAFGMELGYAA